MNRIEEVAIKIEHGIEAPFKFIDRAAAVLETAVKDQPEVKLILTTLIAKCEAIGAQCMIDVGERGLNIVDDLKTASEIKDLGSYILSTVKPEFEKLYGEIKFDVVTK